MKEYSGTIDNVPTGIVSCTCNQKIYTLLAFSMEHICLRTEKTEELSEINKVSFQVFSWEKGGFHSYGPFAARKVQVSEHRFYKEVILAIEDACYQDVATELIQLMQQYIWKKMNSEGNAFSKELVGYPSEKDEDFSKDYASWKAYDGRQQKIDRLKAWLETQAVELAVSLENTKAWEKFLANQLTTAFQRIYIGNAYCHNLFPDEHTLFRLLEKARESRIEITLVLPYLRENMVKKWDNILRKVAQWCIEEGIHIELEWNDWGYMEYFKDQWNGEDKKAFSFNYGRLLNKRRKDPRHLYKNGWSQKEEMLMENSLNDEDFLSYLKEKGFSRMELEVCGYSMQIPEGKASLHMPFYQTNTSQYCPLCALVEHEDRGKQSFPLDCKELCKDYMLLYANHLSLIGRYNSILALDEGILENQRLLEEYITCGVERIVWNDV